MFSMGVYSPKMFTLILDHFLFPQETVKLNQRPFWLNNQYRQLPFKKLIASVFAPQ